MVNLSEARDLNLYKKLLRVLGDYTDAFPATGVDGLFNQLLEAGIKSMPKDSKALLILDSIINDNDKSIPAKVQELLNIRFADLATDICPMYRVGNRREVAFWNRDDVLNDKVISLIDFTGKGKPGFWSSVERKKVELLNFDTKESK
jgi:hypothetical protein